MKTKPLDLRPQRKVITQDGKVTLRGPVRSEEEKSSMQAKAAAVAGEENQLEVMPATN
jgi:hypothetical protein